MINNFKLEVEYCQPYTIIISDINNWYNPYGWINELCVVDVDIKISNSFKSEQIMDSVKNEDNKLFDDILRKEYYTENHKYYDF